MATIIPQSQVDTLKQAIMEALNADMHRHWQHCLLHQACPDSLPYGP